MITAVFVYSMGARFSLNLAFYTPPTLVVFFTDFQWNMLEYVLDLNLKPSENENRPTCLNRATRIINQM